MLKAQEATGPPFDVARNGSRLCAPRAVAALPLAQSSSRDGQI